MFLSFIRTLVTLDLGPTFLQYDLILITFAKTLFPNKVTLPGRHEVLRDTLQPSYMGGGMGGGSGDEMMMVVMVMM